MERDEILFYLRNVRARRSPSSPLYEEVKEDLKKEKEYYLEQNDQTALKEIWCLEEVLNVQNLFIMAFQQMKNGEFYKAWCTLEQCEIGLMNLSAHYPIDNLYDLKHIGDYVERFQSLFPYKVFFSPEMVEKEKKCNICGKKVTPRNPCGHHVGEIYNGELCIREVTQVEFLGLAFVSSPVQKYSVPFLSNEDGNEVDHYNYKLVKYVITRLPSPFHEWEIEWKKIQHPLPLKYRGLKRNDDCPCGSGKKYKKCCQKELESLKDHCDIHFNFDLPKKLLNIEYPDAYSQ
jgi:hypothetical protein